VEDAKGGVVTIPACRRFLRDDELLAEVRLMASETLSRAASDSYYAGSLGRAEQDAWRLLWAKAPWLARELRGGQW
jgi:hypothetical protein